MPNITPLCDDCDSSGGKAWCADCGSLALLACPWCDCTWQVRQSELADCERCPACRSTTKLRHLRRAWLRVMGCGYGMLTRRHCRLLGIAYVGRY
jgi:hypothetical protein